MKVLVTGPESSGTNYLTGLVAEGGAEAVHRSQPEGADWIDMAAMLDNFDAVVVVLRGRYAHLRSYQRRDIEPTEPLADQRRRKALASLSGIMGHPKVTVVTYESLASPTERRHLLESLGLDVDAADQWRWYDANAKYQTT